MTAPFRTRRRAEAFAAAVDGRPHRPDPELTELVGVVGTLRSAAADPAATPRPEFAAELRSLLLAEAHTALSGDASLALPVRRRGTRERRLAAVASAAVLLGGSMGMAAAAQSALPGDALYPVKRGLERAAVVLSLSAEGKGQDLLHQAADRLAEVDGMLAEDAVAAEPRIPATLADFAAQAEEGTDLLLGAYQETRDPHSIVVLREFTAEGTRTLQSLAAEAPASVQDELAEAALLLGRIDEQALTLCASCAPDLPPLQVPGIFLTSGEVDRALALLEDRTLSNDHPVIVPREVLLELGGTLGSDGGSGESGSTGSTGVTLPGQDEVTSGDKPLKETVDGAVEGAGDAVKDTTDKVDETVEDTDDTVGDLTDGIEDAVGTILPDPSLELP